MTSDRARVCDMCPLATPGIPRLGDVDLYVTRTFGFKIEDAWPSFGYLVRIHHMPRRAQQLRGEIARICFSLLIALLS